MKLLRLDIWTALVLGAASFVGACGPGNQREQGLGLDPTQLWQALPELPGEDKGLSRNPGVSAPFVGIYQDWLLVAGGCNFPSVPAAEGGPKVYYAGVQALSLRRPELGWKHVGELPKALAYGAAVTTPRGVLCIGGTDGKQVYSQVLLMARNPKGGTLVREKLPDLPLALDNFAAAYFEGAVYVAGGNADGLPSHRVFVLDCPALAQALSLPAEPGTSMGGQWRELPAYPGPARVQPVLAVQQSPDGPRLYLSGGYAPAHGEVEAQVSSTLLSLDLTPALAQDLVHKPWREEPSVPLTSEGRPRTFSGGCALPYADSLVLFFCGVNHHRFHAALNRNLFIDRARAQGDTATLHRLQKEGTDYMHHPASWYRFNPELWAFHTAKGTWTFMESAEPLARAGAGAVLQAPYLIVVNGELKPGIRTPQVNVLNLSLLPK